MWHLLGLTWGALPWRLRWWLLGTSQGPGLCKFLHARGAGGGRGELDVRLARAARAKLRRSRVHPPNSLVSVGLVCLFNPPLALPEPRGVKASSQALSLTHFAALKISFLDLQGFARKNLSPPSRCPTCPSPVPVLRPQNGLKASKVVLAAQHPAQGAWIMRATRFVARWTAPSLGAHLCAPRCNDWPPSLNLASSLLCWPKEWGCEGGWAQDFVVLKVLDMYRMY